MQRLMVGLAVVVLGLLGSTGVASATHGPTDNPPRDLFQGAGEASSVSIAMRVSATSGPLGENANGHLSEPSQDARVTCLVVSGNRATAGGTITGSSPNTLFFVAEDNPDPAPDRVTRLSGGGDIPANQAGCALFHTLFAGALFPLTSGDLTIHDGQPRP
jgi:hypothetical protein